MMPDVGARRRARSRKAGPRQEPPRQTSVIQEPLEKLTFPANHIAVNIYLKCLFMNDAVMR